MPTTLIAGTAGAIVAEHVAARDEAAQDAAQDASAVTSGQGTSQRDETAPANGPTQSALEGSQRWTIPSPFALTERAEPGQIALAQADTAADPPSGGPAEQTAVSPSNATEPAGKRAAGDGNSVVGDVGTADDVLSAAEVEIGANLRASSTRVAEDSMVAVVRAETPTRVLDPQRDTGTQRQGPRTRAEEWAAPSQEGPGQIPEQHEGERGQGMPAGGMGGQVLPAQVIERSAVSRAASEAPVRETGEPDLPVLEAFDIRKSLPLGKEHIEILRGINLYVRRRELIAIVGPSGSGKSTLLGIIAGLDSPTSGQVMIDGMDITYLSEGHLAAVRNSKIGMVYQAFNLIPNLTAQENVEIPLYASKYPGSPVARAQELLRLVGLEHRMKNRPGQLSGGEQQRVAVARALATNPSIVIMDEPTGNLDQKNSEHVLEMIRDLRARTGTTFIIATHDPDVARAADRAIHIVDGQVQDTPPPMGDRWPAGEEVA
jgi:putative ABC transport system ATP-binding protein